MGPTLEILHNDIPLQDPPTPNQQPQQVYILHHERVELKTLADKPTSLLPLLDTVNNKFKLSKLFWSSLSYKRPLLICF